MTFPAYEAPREITPSVSVVLENNPGPMTLDGTNTYVLRTQDVAGCVVVDPGENDAAHLRQVAAAAPVELVMLTHHHPDHAGGAAEFAALVDAPVRAFDPALCVGAAALADGQRIEAAGLAMTVLHTPGHTDDSISLYCAGSGFVLTGDTILGRGTTVVHQLGDYLDSLGRLAELPNATRCLPGHGPDLPDTRTVATEYIHHRRQRLDQVSSALRTLGSDASPRQIVEFVYADVDPVLWPTAEQSVRAQLEYLKSA